MAEAAKAAHDDEAEHDGGDDLGAEHATAPWLGVKVTRPVRCDHSAVAAMMPTPTCRAGLGSAGSRGRGWSSARWSVARDPGLVRMPITRDPLNPPLPAVGQGLAGHAFVVGLGLARWIGGA